MEEFEKNFQTAIKSLKIADHMTYVTYPLVTEQRLLLKIFDEIHKSVINCINTILNYEYLYKRIRIYKDNRDNLETFIKCAKRYDLNNEQIKKNTRNPKPPQKTQRKRNGVRQKRKNSNSLR